MFREILSGIKGHRASEVWYLVKVGLRPSWILLSSPSFFTALHFTRELRVAQKLGSE